MKILWIVNMVLPRVATELNMSTSASGGWLEDYAYKLAEDPNVELATMTYANVAQDIDETVCGIRNFIFAGGGKRLLLDHPQTLKDCQTVLERFQPDLIHIHGTEYSMGAAMLKVKPNVPVVLTIQGILARIAEEYYGGMSFLERCKTVTLKSLLKLNAPYFAKKLLHIRADREAFVLKNVKHVTGRTEWDKSVMLSINDQLVYHRFNYNLRAAFYEAEKWDLESIDRHTIYTGSGTYPLKGLHVLIRALAIVKKRYPDVQLRIPANQSDYKKANGYEKYILRLIKKLKLEKNVCFVGRQNAQQVAQLLAKSHVCVIPSAIEGASATMCEAMMIGTPGICAYRGGMTDLLHDGESGFFYDFKEYSVLASRIMTLFEDDALCQQFSLGQKRDANRRHARERNYQQLLEIYDMVHKETNHA